MLIFVDKYCTVLLDITQYRHILADIVKYCWLYSIFFYLVPMSSPLLLGRHMFLNVFKMFLNIAKLNSNFNQL